MRFWNYFKLAFSNVVGHKRQSLIVITIVSIIFSILTTIAIIISGIENNVNYLNTIATNNRVLLVTTIDNEVCGNNCNIDEKLSVIKQTIAKYNGDVFEAKVYQSEGELFYELPKGIIQNEGIKTIQDENIPTVMVSAATASKWLQLLMPDQVSIRQKLNVVEQVQKRSVGKVISYSNVIGDTKGQKTNYYVAGLLPAGMGVSSFDLSNVKQSNNPLNLVLGGLLTGDSVNLVLNINGSDSFEKVVNSKQVWASFDDLESAYNYSQDKINVCSEIDAIMKRCPRAYVAKVQTVIGDPLSNFATFIKINKTLQTLMIILGIVALMVMIVTFVRLLNYDRKKVALYYALGASHRNVLGIYLAFLFILCCLTILVVTVLTLCFTLLINLINAEALNQIFTLAYGTTKTHIILFGFNNTLWYLVGIIFLSIPISLLISWPLFRKNNLVSKF